MTLNHHLLVEAETALDALFKDTSVDKAETLDNLYELQSVIISNICALKEELKDKK